MSVLAFMKDDGSRQSDRPVDFSVERAADWLVKTLSGLDGDELIAAINSVRQKIHDISPFASEPVDCVIWVRSDMLEANDYNPNSVAPPEMELLKHSIEMDGYTQPIVAWRRDDKFEVVDGFHRNRVGRECKAVRDRIRGYLPVTAIKHDRAERSDRIASTIRHNRARGKHAVTSMSDIVIELKRRNWSDSKIGKELGMDPDEVLRLCQISGLADAFKDQSFSEAWEVEREYDGDEEAFSDIIAGFEHDDKGRIFHEWEKWECYKAGFFAERPTGMTVEDGEAMYESLLGDEAAFENALSHVIQDWKYSCEHNLTNDRMNRIAWLGQASCAFAHGIPAICRGGYHRLNDEKKRAADQLALKYLNKWLTANGRDEVSLEQAVGRTEAELY